MPLPIEIAVARYNLVRDEVRERAPDEWDVVIRLCRDVPQKVDVDAFWRHGKDKPCWSNIRVEVGVRIASDLTLSQDFESYERIAGNDWAIEMREKGRRWRLNTNFDMVGEAARQVIDGLKRGGLASFIWRLYAIRQFALSLSQEEGTLPMVRALVDRPDRLRANEVYPWATQFARLAGTGWGATTVSHMLTDLGLSVKPDLQLRRSAVRMGLLSPEVSSELPVEEIDRRAVELDPMVVRAVMELSEHVLPTAVPTARSSLREIDKVLMEWSRQGLLRPL